MRESYEELCVACSVGDRSAMRKLFRRCVEAGVDINQRSLTEGLKGFSAAGAAALGGHLPTLIEMLDLGASPLKCDVANCIMAAAKGGHTQTVKHLIDIGIHADAGLYAINGKISGGSAISYAASAGHFDTVVFLMSKGASLNIVDANNLLPVNYANEYPRIFDLLLSGTDKKFHKRSLRDRLGMLEEFERNNPSRGEELKKEILASNNPDLGA